LEKANCKSINLDFLQSYIAKYQTLVCYFQEVTSRVIVTFELGHFSFQSGLKISSEKDCGSGPKSVLPVCSNAPVGQHGGGVTAEPPAFYNQQDRGKMNCDRSHSHVTPLRQTNVIGSAA
jgi:hypothetical protein